MEVKEVTVNVGVTKNMGNYESLRIDYSLKVQLDDNDVPIDTVDNLRETLAEKIRTDLADSNGGRDWLKKQ